MGGSQTGPEYTNHVSEIRTYSTVEFEGTGEVVNFLYGLKIGDKFIMIKTGRYNDSTDN